MPMRCSRSASLVDRWQSVRIAQLGQHQGKDRIRVSGIARLRATRSGREGKGRVALWQDPAIDLTRHLN
jgi:hypothetical protein